MHFPLFCSNLYCHHILENKKLSKKLKKFLIFLETCSFKDISTVELMVLKIERVL
jgi:hypothetical protein